MHHSSEAIAGRQVVDLTPADIATLLATASAEGASGLVLATSEGIVGSVHSSGVTRTLVPHGFGACGPVCWLRTDTQPYLAWASVQAWGRWLCTQPETIREFVAAGRMLPFVGKHVGDLSAQDLELALEYATVRGYAGVEFDISALGFISGAHIVDGVELDEIDSTFAGVTVGIGASADEALLRMQLTVRAADLDCGDILQ